MRLVSVLVLVGALCLCTGAAFADPKNDTGENWDHIWQGERATYTELEPNGDCATAQAVALGDVVDPAAINVAADLDFYKIYLLTTDRLSVIMDRATGCTTTIDTQVYIYSDDCVTQLGYDDDDGPGLYSYIAGSEWTPPYDGYYYVRAKAYSATVTGCYKIWFYSGTAATGACCATAGTCTVTAPGACSSPSTWQGPGTACDPNPCVVAPTGACCSPTTGACTLVVQASCYSPSIWHAEWTVCTPNPCPVPVTGACCATTGFCTLTIQTNCVSPSVWQGANTVCVPNTCPGAQPAPVNDTCAGAIAIARCATGTITGDLTWANNDYTTAGSTGCTGYPASGLDVVYVVDLVAGDVLHLVYTTPSHDGSLYVITDCANPTTTCVIGEDDPEPETITWTATATGTYYIIADAYSGGAAFTLDYAITCPPPVGSCCYVDGTCAVTIQADCTGTWTEAGVCEPNTCPPPPIGSCCYLDGTCAVTTQANCTGTWTEAGVCEPNTCPPPQNPGSCCYLDGTCAVTEQADCTGIWTLGGLCDPNTCAQPTGSCCYADGTCAVTEQAACTATWLLGGVCEPNTCEQPPALGACCDHATGNCTITTQALCGFDWLGAGVPCDASTCFPPTPVEKTSWGQIKNTYR